MSKSLFGKKPGRAKRKAKPEPEPLPAYAGKAAARIRHPTNPRLFYRHGAEPPWVEFGYTKWSIASWHELFGQVYNSAQDTRNWDFYGETIEIWPPNEGGYSDE
jgi:hypothetical protein